MMTSNATAIAQTRARLFEVMAGMDVEPSDIPQRHGAAQPMRATGLGHGLARGRQRAVWRGTRRSALQCDLAEPIERAFHDAEFVRSLLLTGTPRGGTVHWLSPGYFHAGQRGGR